MEHDKAATTDDNSREQSSVEHALAGRAGLLNDIHLQALPEAPRSEAPLIAIYFAFAGSLFIIAGLWIDSLSLLLRSLGVGLMAMLLLTLLLEMIWRKVTVHSLAQRLKPIIGELEEVREFVNSYLTALDKRTSRYFHCVTNTKVTTYFMLRQIEGALTEMVSDCSQHLAKHSPASYNYVRERLRGVLQYRDGFEFNDGKLYYLPLPRLVSGIQDMIAELEAGIELLEDEIRLSADRLRQPLEDNKQLPLSLK